MTSARKQQWSYSAGERGRNRVRAFEHPTTGKLFLEFYESKTAGRVTRKRLALGHRDRGQAKRQADEVAAKFAVSGTTKQSPSLTLDALFDMYLADVTPHKTASSQTHDRSVARVMTQFFGASRPVASLNRRDWDRYIHERRRGGVKMPRWSRARRVGNNQIRHDLRFLLAVLNWATRAGDGDGAPLLDRNPLKGLPIPVEESPKRPIITADEYGAMRRVADRVSPLFALALVLAHETGHRIGAIRALKWSDADRVRGVMRWRAVNDKIGFEHYTPLTQDAVDALDAVRAASPAIGDTWIFPDSANPTQHLTRHVTEDWWMWGERLAGIERVKGRGWHSLRRNFATEMKDTPLRDLAHLGGWKDATTILKCYQRPDAVTMRQALAKRRPLELERSESTPPTDTAVQAGLKGSR